MTSDADQAALETYDAIIIGGGVAGMSAMLSLRDKKVLLLEKDERLGGRLLSHDRGELWLNLGGHLFPGAESTLGGVVRELGLATLPIPGSKFGIAWEGKTHANNRVETYPFSLDLTLRERVAFAVAGLRVLGLVNRWRRLEKRADTDRGDRAQAISTFVGRDFASVVTGLPPRVRALFATAARRASAELPEQSAATAAQLFAGVWAGKRSSLAFNLDGGSGRLGEAMHREFGDGIMTGFEVSEVETDSDVVRVRGRTEAGLREFQARNVIIATPADVAARIGSDLPKSIRKKLAEVTYGAFVSMAIRTAKTVASPLDQIYAVTTPGLSFDMLFNHANPLAEKGLAPRGSLMVYAGGDRAQEMLAWDDAKIRSVFLADVMALYPYLQGKIEENIIHRWPLGLPYLAPNFDLSPLFSYADTSTRVHLSGDYFGALGNMELAAVSGVRAADRAREQLGT